MTFQRGGLSGEINRLPVDEWAWRFPEFGGCSMPFLDGQWLLFLGRRAGRFFFPGSYSW